jgi:hypothetical protein
MSALGGNKLTRPRPNSLMRPVRLAHRTRWSSCRVGIRQTVIHRTQGSRQLRRCCHRHVKPSQPARIPVQWSYSKITELKRQLRSGRLRQGQAPNVAGWRGQDLASGRRGHRTLERSPDSGPGRHPRLTPTSLDSAGSRWTVEARYSRPETVLDTLNGFASRGSGPSGLPSGGVAVPSGSVCESREYRGHVPLLADPLRQIHTHR